jgi:hypothetical protein
MGRKKGLRNDPENGGRIMQALKITGLQYGSISDIEECLVVKNECVVQRVPKFDKPKSGYCDGLAYAVICKGQQIGWIPLVRSIEGYVEGALTKDAAARLREWWVAAVKVRGQLWIDSDLHGTDEWRTRICEILYYDGEKRIRFAEYSALSPEKQSGWRLEQVSIMFENVEGE